jgi:putative ABC transport system permease protein
MRRGVRVGGRSTFPLVDLLNEAIAGVVQRPARSVLTALGTVLGIGSFVAILGLTSTATGQIGKQFNALVDATVTVTDVGDGAHHPRDAPAPIDFPADADARISRLNGVVAAGVYWTIPLAGPAISATPGATQAQANELPVYGVSPGLFNVMRPQVTGALFNSFHQRRAEHVVVLGSAAARNLGISQLSAQPAVFINGIAFTVIGIISRSVQLPSLLLGVLMPSHTARLLYPPPDPANGPAVMVIHTDLGAASLIARQAALALRPDEPRYLQAIAPPDPHTLRDNVNTDLASLFLALAAISMAIGAVGIANTTLVAVLERTSEIGLRRAVGARPRHIAWQFLTESSALGALGGLVGTALGVGTVLSVAAAKHWTAILNPAVVLPAPLIGAGVGLLAGLYPAVRAASTEPLDALRR